MQPNPKPVPPQTLINSGLDAVIWFDCSIKESLRRADGRRVDGSCEDEKPFIFHVDDLKPPTNEAPLCERLIHIKDDSNCTGTLIDRYVSFDQATRSLKVWLTKFGIESTQRNLLQIINAGQAPSDVTDQMTDIIDSVLRFKTEKINTAREIMAFRIKQIQEERLRLAKEEEEKRIANQSADKLVERIGTPSHKSEKVLVEP